MSHARPLSLAALAAFAVLCCGCKSLRRPLVVDSEPPGAIVWIDGVDSGFATPCVLDLDDRDVRTVDIVLAGYQTERRELRDGEWSRAILWPEMSVGLQTWRFPLFLSPEHMFGPVEQSDGEMPHRIHARLLRDRAE